MSTFSDRIVIARNKKGISQKRLAEILEITPTRLNYWEKGKREPDVEMIKKISIALDVDPNFLVGLNEDSNKSQDNFTIGHRIKKRREELGLTVAEVADRLNKNRATVYRYESDEIENLPLTVLEPLSKVLKTTPAELIGYGENGDGDEISLAEAKKLFTDIFVKEGIIKPGQDLSDEQYKKAMQVLRALFDETGQ